jgi:hypothetical protein
MTQTFNVDEILSNPSLLSLHDITRMFVSKIITIARKNNCNRIILNRKLSIIIQDISSYSLQPLNQLNFQTSNRYYNIGKLSGINVLVDNNQSWDDNYILFDTNLKEKRFKKLNTILGNTHDENFIDKLILIDKYNKLV